MYEGDDSDSDHYIYDDDDNNENDNVDDDTDNDNNGDIRSEAFTTAAAEGIKSPQVASCGNLEQIPLF